MSDRDKTSPLTPGAERPQREKRWDECGIEDKVERLRGALRGLQRHVVILAPDHYKLRSEFEQHEHGRNGNVVAPVNTRHGGVMAGECGRRDLLD